MLACLPSTRDPAAYITVVYKHRLPCKEHDSTENVWMWAKTCHWKSRCHRDCFSEDQPVSQEVAGCKRKRGTCNLPKPKKQRRRSSGGVGNINSWLLYWKSRPTGPFPCSWGPKNAFPHQRTRTSWFRLAEDSRVSWTLKFDCTRFFGFAKDGLTFFPNEKSTTCRIYFFGGEIFHKKGGCSPGASTQTT